MVLGGMNRGRQSKRRDESREGETGKKKGQAKINDGRKSEITQGRKEEGKETLNDRRKERRETSGNDRTEKMKEQGKRGNKRKLNCSPSHI